MRDLIEEPGGGAASETEAVQPAVAVPRALPSGIELHNR
ncbi:MAG: site-specific DNA-methyltransferase, partial [Burkholderia sp.]|nr:site-specific DNA-methyltransferase [Burkholderia sp.]